MQDTEHRILEAARIVFIKKGLEGARMQEIADEAGINKALLHYYFRSKEKLFNHIFESALRGVFDIINASIHEEGDIFIFIETFVGSYLGVLQKNPFLPNFIFNEINSNPDRLNQVASRIKLNIPGYLQMVKKNIAQKKIRSIDPEHLIIDIMGMCVFPYIGRPLIEKIIIKDKVASTETFLYKRKQHIITFLKTALQQ